MACSSGWGPGGRGNRRVRCKYQVPFNVCSTAIFNLHSLRVERALAHVEQPHPSHTLNHRKAPKKLKSHHACGRRAAIREGLWAARKRRGRAAVAVGRGGGE